VWKYAIPVLHVSSAAAAERYYCGQLGFRRVGEHRADPVKADPAYLVLVREGVSLHLSSFSGDGVAGGVVNLVVEDVDEVHAELVGRGVAIDSGPMDQTWGTRELYIKDADGNSLRFQAMLEPAA
jgi:catechol 2,3-dioxygenase-like lactoylglutathione lyase family enzyme